MANDNELVYGPDVIQAVVEDLTLNHVVLSLLTPLTFAQIGGVFGSEDEFTAKVRVKGKLQAREMGIGETGGYNSDGSRKTVVYDKVSDSFYPIEITDKIYSGVPMTDEQKTLGPADLYNDIVSRQAEAVREKAEAKAVALLVNAQLSQANVPFHADTDPYDLLVDGVAELADRGVPGPYYFVMGTDTSRRVRKHPSVKSQNYAGDRSQNALAKATVTELGGATLVDATGASGLPRDFAMLLSSSAFAYLMVPPQLNAGSTGGQANNGEVSYRWVLISDEENGRSKSLLDTFWGELSINEDKTDAANPKNVRAIRFDLLNTPSA